MSGAPRLMLAGGSVDRAALHRTDDAWLAAAWDRAKVLLLSAKSATPTTSDTDGAMRLALRDSTDVDPTAPRRFLGVVDGVPHFTVITEPGDERWPTLREVGLGLTEVESALVTAAIGLEQWHLRHSCCAICGTPTVETHAGWVRHCPKDGSDHFPRTDPAVIMIVRDSEDRALLGRNSQWPVGRFSTLAGFVEPGESLEDAVAREVFEEVGVRIADIRYVASQPWPFPSSLMLGFSAKLDGASGLNLDPVEIADAGWFTRAEVTAAARWSDDGVEPDPVAIIRGVSPQLSISRYLIDLWLAHNLP